MATPPLKRLVQEFWERSSCGESYARGETLRGQLAEQARQRYELEPYIAAFAEFDKAHGLDVLEVGVGMGADHLRLAQRSPRRLVGVDLTWRAVQFTAARLALNGTPAKLVRADAESMPFSDASFDIVYSWGVLHHSPDTQKAVDEIFRVLRPGGRVRVMIYNSPSIVGLLLWVRYALLTGRWRLTLDDVCAQHLESPGTKAYRREAARNLFTRFEDVDIKRQLSFADLLQGTSGARHAGRLARTAKVLWPRWLIRSCFAQLGLYLCISASRPSCPHKYSRSTSLDR